MTGQASFGQPRINPQPMEAFFSVKVSKVKHIFGLSCGRTMARHTCWSKDSLLVSLREGSNSLSYLSTFPFVFTDDDNGDLLLPNGYLLVSDWECWIDGILGAFQCKRITTNKRKPLLYHNCQQKWIIYYFCIYQENLMGFYYNLTFQVFFCFFPEYTPFN